MTSPTVKLNPLHIIVRRRITGGETKVICACGASWTHKASETEDQMQSIYESHLLYFKRKPMETL